MTHSAGHTGPQGTSPSNNVGNGLAIAGLVVMVRYAVAITN